VRSRHAVSQALRETTPDVVHVYYGLSGAALPLTGSPPVVLTLCGSDILRWHAWGDARGFLEYGVSVATALRARAIVVQSAAIREALPSARLRRRVKVLMTGIDSSLFRVQDRAECRQRLGWDTDRPVVLFGADPRRRVKRFRLAVEVCRSVLNQFGLTVELRALAGVPPEEVPIQINAADCVLITSAWEAGPIVLTEALACGVPVVTVAVGYATDPHWPDEYVRVAADTPDALATALVDLLRHPPAHRHPPGLSLPSERDYALRLADLYREVA
jgi:glycosyltransferase involved in cell wall biosynthesis